MTAPSLTESRPSAGASRGGSSAGARATSRWWLLLLAVPVVEVIAHLVTQSRVVEASDWERAAAMVDREWREGDAVIAAPGWADPLMRSALGERIDARIAGASDLAGYQRLWELSIRGHRSSVAPARAPDEVHTAGRVRVSRWDLEPEVVAYDLVDHVMDAEVTLIEGGDARACSRVHQARASGTGGLAGGPMAPPERHVCDPRRPWLWVGETVQEDLAFAARRCVWQHPPGPEPVRTTYRDVPLGERVVLYAGLWWEHERTMDGGPVDVVVRVDGREIGRLVHRDGDGWKRMEAAIPEALRGGRGTIDVDVSAPNPHLRTLCWAASTRGAPVERGAR